MKSEYLIFNLIIIIFPLIVPLFYKKALKVKIKPLLYCFLLVSIPFIIWDQLVTNVFWYFNEAYTLGPKIIKLPFEEAMFFFTVPVSSLFLWINFDHQFKFGSISPRPVWVLFIALFIFGLSRISTGEWYTNIMLVLPLFTLLVDKFMKTNIVTSRSYLYYQPLLFTLTFIFNGYLTSRPVVTYNPQMLTGIQLYTIPIEDFVYGWVLITLFAIIYKNTSITNK